nr:hypothetical protein [Tanacetum cinerariifolium]
MKDSSLAQDADPDMWVILKEKFEKSLVIFETCRHTVFRKRDHDGHSGAPSKGEKSAKKLKTSKGTKSKKGASSVKYNVQESKAPSSTKQHDFDDPFTGIVYENSKKERIVMNIEELPKLCDATLSKVLKKVEEINVEA